MLQRLNLFLIVILSLLGGGAGAYLIYDEHDGYAKKLPTAQHGHKMA